MQTAGQRIEVGRIAICRASVGRCLAASFLLLSVAIPSLGREKKDAIQYGAGLIVNVEQPEPEVALVVEEIAQNTIIRGTKEYNKDEYVTGAEAAKSTAVFPAWTEGGKVYYKVRKEVVDPRNFKDAGDLGTLAVRYVVQPEGDKNTVLRIDAVFVEDFRHGVHASNGSVESSEYKLFQDRLASVNLVKKETEEALRQKQELQAKQNFNSEVLSTPPVKTSAEAATQVESKATGSNTATREPSSGSGIFAATSGVSDIQDPNETLEQHVASLRHQVERLVRKPGAALKSAPFHTASTLKSLDPGAEVLILVTSAYWYGIETRDGQHGWLLRDQVEELP